MKMIVAMKSIFILPVLLVLSFGVSAQVVINEYSCSNMNGPLDAFNQREDWVELLNTGAAAVNLAGYYLSDDKNSTQKWQIPAGATIAPNARMMVFCSDRSVFTSGQLHPSFKLTQTRGEYFVIANSAGVIVDSVHLIPTQANHSRGRVTDGAASWGLFSTPTPNGANVNAKTAYAVKPVFNVAPGFYAAAQNVALSSPDPNVTIHYTTDGTTPTIGSTTYTVPIAVNVTTPIRAVAFSTDPMILPSFTETNTYFINETVAPAMNVISVCGPYNTLFTGFTSSGISTTVEYFEYTNHQFKFEFEGISRPHGHDSWAYPQKSFRLYVKDEFGYDYAMKYKFFNNSTRDTFQQIILKAGASDNYPFQAQYSGNSNPSCHVRDAFAHTLAQKYNLDIDSRKYAPTVVFINGQYWGIYEIREKVNGDYTEYYYGQPEKKIDLLSYWGGLQIRAGSDTGWVNLYNYMMANSLAVTANYEHVKNFLDVKGFAEYFIYNTWLVNSDWLTWNTMWWRGRKGAGVKWRYAAWDMDNVCGLGENFTGWPTTGYQADPCKPFDFFQNNSTIKHTDMLVRLMQNTEFNQLYRSTFIDMLNGPLNCAHMVPHFDSLINILQPEMQRQVNRWGNATYDYAQWQANVQNMRNWILTRCQLIAQKLDSCMDLNPQQISFNVSPANSGTIKMDGTLISPYVWSRIIEGDSIYNLLATPSNGYYFFDHWEKYEAANTFTPDSLTDNVTYGFNKRDSVVAFFRYFNPDSVNITFDVTPPGKGTIKLDNALISSYPYTVKLDRRVTYALAASPVTNYLFFNWKKKRSTSSLSPTSINDKVNFSFTEADTIVANFQYDPPTATLPSAPPIPGLDQDLIVPSAFSPNNDGRNDLFHIIKGKDVKSIELRVYDRWGNLVYHSTDAKEGWDGTYKGEPAETGTYFYVLTAWFDNDFLNSTKMYKGEVTLIR